MGEKQYSLRLRLLLLIAIPLVFAGAGVGSFALFNAYHEIEEVYDAELAHTAKLLLQLTEHELREHKTKEIKLGIEDNTVSHPYEKSLAFRIWKNGALITQSGSAELFQSFYAPPGFSHHQFGDDKWRFFVYLGEKSGITVEVAERQDVRMDITLDLARSLLLPFSLFIPVLLLIVWLGTSKSLQPLSRLSVAVDRRDVDDLSPLQGGQIPHEVHALVMALNKLFGRMESSIRREREFTDNAAHELRTPLAAMKTQAQVLLKKTQNKGEKEGLDNLLASIDRAAYMVDQLLSFARLQSQNMLFEDLDFSGLVTDVLREASPLAVAKKQIYEADVLSGVKMKGNKDALQIMIRNVLENAIKFTPDKSAVHVSLAEDGGRITLSVVDTGPGIPEDQKEKIFDRFYRGDKSRVQGSGLGLAMVKWVCDIHDGRIEVLDGDPKGSIIQIVF